jgi:hypothetical protein
MMMLDEEFHKPRPPLAGYVYLMRNARGWYKIGHSINPRKRRAQLSSEGNTIRIVLLILTNDMIALELDLQRRYIWKRQRDEWFKLNRMDLAMIMHHHPAAVRYNPETFDWKTGQAMIEQER